MTSKFDAVGAYCEDLVTEYHELSQSLSLPLLDRELYGTLFFSTLVDQHCSAMKTLSPKSSFSSNVSATANHAESLLSLGGAELIVKALRSHEQQTLLTMQAIALRESVMAQIKYCCDLYRDGTALSDEAKFTFLCLLEEHQIAALLTIESILKWREALTRPYPFLLKNGENYLLEILSDSCAIHTTKLCRSIPQIRLRQDPLCTSVDLRKLLHRLQTKHRTRLVNSGAIWKLGLQPLQPIAPKAPPRDVDGPRGRPATATRAAEPAVVRRASGDRTPVDSSRSSKAASLDFLAEVRRITAVLYKTIDKDSATPLHPSSGSSSRPSWVPSPKKGAERDAVQLAPQRAPRTKLSRKQAREAPTKEQRLLTANRVLQEEVAVQRCLTEELYELAQHHGQFVPLLDVPFLFCPSAIESKEGEVTEDSWPLEKAQWVHAGSTEGRVDRLGCMAAAREALQVAHLLSAWQLHMSGSIGDFAAPGSRAHSTPNRSLSHSS